MSKNYWNDQEGKPWLKDPAILLALISVLLFLIVMKLVS